MIDNLFQAQKNLLPALKEKIQLCKPKVSDLVLKSLSSSQAIQYPATLKDRIRQQTDNSSTFLPKSKISTSIHPLAQLYYRLKFQYSNRDRNSICQRFDIYSSTTRKPTLVKSASLISVITSYMILSSTSILSKMTRKTLEVQY